MLVGQVSQLQIQSRQFKAASLAEPFLKALMQLLAVETEAALRQRHNLPCEQPVQGSQLLRVQLPLQMLIEVARQACSFATEPLHVLRNPVAIANNLIGASTLYSGNERNLGLVGCTRMLDATLQRLASVDQREPALQFSLPLISRFSAASVCSCAHGQQTTLPVMLQLLFGLLDAGAGLLQVS
ncbi:hypothetical protein ULG90_02400 [Halopseudomonas pachastrellae]|nr:hypothetical protein ULG90_02400 [Halopseudomonas pachastrellae]